MSSRLLRFPGAVRRDPAIETWMQAHTGPLGTIARRWFEVMRGKGNDVRELLHDGHPTACIGDAAFAYVNAFTAHVNVGFFRGADLVDPHGLLEGTGQFMRHVKLRPAQDVDGNALAMLIETAYRDMQSRVTLSHRVATMGDVAELRALMTASIRQLLGAHLDELRVEASFEIMGLDTQLIEDGTYFVVECEGEIAGCGGWSRRATLFGGNHSAGRSARLLDPETEPARVRAMYTHPAFARRGIGRLVLSLCEAAASREGFRSLELAATVAGEPLYTACGFTIIERTDVVTSKGVAVPCARMAKPTIRRSSSISGLASDGSVVSWLLDSDPSIRWQVLRDLTNATVEEVTAARAKIATEGWGATLLSLQGVDGRWGDAAWNRGWNSTMHVLWLLRVMGLDPACAEARRAVARVHDHVTWRGCGPPECDGHTFFAGEVEPCINGQVAAAGAYFGQDVRGIIDRLLAKQLADGGWNCDAPDRSMRSSFNSTMCVLEALLEHERATGGSPHLSMARLRGQEYLLERRLFRRRSTGEAIERDRKGGAMWTRFAFPTWWHYDVLRGLDYLRSAGVMPDERVAEAVALVASKRAADGRWPVEARYPGVMLVEVEANEGQPSRWNTLRALRVLEWYGSW